MRFEHPLLDKYNYPRNEIEELIEAYRSGKINQHDNIIREPFQCPQDDDLKRLPPADSQDYNMMEDIGIKSLEDGELAMVILNGGMATRFGGVVKGTVEVFDGRSFLELKIRDGYHVSHKTRFIIMNSFATAAKTSEHLKMKEFFGMQDSIWMFDQFIAPRITEDGTYLDTSDPQAAFYGPGHGDFPYALKTSGLLDKFIDGGGKYIFFSNVDNLGARIVPAMLGFHIMGASELTAEVAEKSSSDIGGAPMIVDGKLQLIEGFCFPDDFDHSQIDVFNCSSYWVNAESLKKDFSLPWYLVKKKVADQAVIQFEHLAGDMTKFLDTSFIRVSRKERFYPIKRPEDLEANRQDLKKILGY
ncbi:UTP--glucose-1-phosphate uridylyltransferase [Elusimicrobiota bacterium]